MADDRHPLFMPLIVLGGLIEGFGLAYSGMARPEIVLDFLQFDDFGLVFVMGGAAVVSSVVFFAATTALDSAPLTGDSYTRRVKSMDRDVVVGGVIFGIGWGLSGICPGAAYASLGVGNVKILWAVAGMFLGAYAQGYWRAYRRESTTTSVTAGD
jgi:uncharacterized membrane protein YedE/YeeE